MEKFTGFLWCTFLVGVFVYFFFGILVFLGVVGGIHILYIMRISRLSEARKRNDVGVLDDIRHGVETRAYVSFLFLLFLDVIFFSAMELKGNDALPRFSTSGSHDGWEMSAFIFMVIGGASMTVISLVAMIARPYESSELKKYVLALSVASISGAVLGITLLKLQYVTLPFSVGTVMLFHTSDTAKVVVPMYVFASFFSARYSCQTGDRAVVYFMGNRLYQVEGHGDIVIPLPSFTFQLLLDLIKQKYILFSVDWEGVRQPLVHDAPREHVTLRIDSASPNSPYVHSPPSKLPPPDFGGGSLTSPSGVTKEEKDELVHPYVKLLRELREKGGDGSSVAEGGKRGGEGTPSTLPSNVVSLAARRRQRS